MNNIAANSVSSISDSAILLAILSTIVWIIQQYCWQYCKQLWSMSFLIFTIQERAMYYWVTEEGGDIGLCLVSAQPANTQCSWVKQLNTKSAFTPFTRHNSIHRKDPMCSVCLSGCFSYFINHQETTHILLNQSNQNRLGIQKRQNCESTLTKAITPNFYNAKYS